MLLDHPSDGLTAIRTHIGAIFVSLELSRSNWLVTSLSPGKGEKMSKHSITAGDIAGLLALFAELKRKAAIRPGSRRRGGAGGPRRTGSMARHCCGRFSPTSAASHGCARWWSALA